MEKDDTNFTNLHEFANQAAQISRKGRQGRKEDKNTRTLNFELCGGEFRAPGGNDSALEGSMREPATRFSGSLGQGFKKILPVHIVHENV
jgi:hypothetical protein